MGYPDELVKDGISWRGMTYYNMSMGGAVANGQDAGNINTVGIQNLTADPVMMTAGLEITSKVNGTNPPSADITVKVTAKQKFPLKTKLHIIVFQTYVNWDKDFGVKPSNGQADMYNVVIDLVTDSTGDALPELDIGQSHSITRTFTVPSIVKQPDSLRMAVLVQVENTKKILSALQTKTSPLSTNAIKTGGYSIIQGRVPCASAFNGQISLMLPFDNTIAVIYTTTGRELLRTKLNGKVGEKASIALPQAGGVLLVKLFSTAGRSVWFTITQIH